MGADGMKTSLNLMTDDDRRRQLMAEARRLWTRVLGVTVLVLTAPRPVRVVAGVRDHPPTRPAGRSLRTAAATQRRMRPDAA